MKRLFCTFLVSSLLVGCTKKAVQVPTVPVSGTVHIGGKPVEGVEVRFITDKFEGFGKTDAQGSYQLVAGAQAGQNKIIFNKKSGGKSAIKLDPEGGMDEGQLQAMQMAAESSGGSTGVTIAKEIIPDEFSKREKTPITFNVPDEGTDKADFKVPAK
jgi:hypothetical protein